ncbi:MAG: hypothetical protein ACTSR3_22790 [Candidatus Helarchaeota archaeon]
MKIEECMCGSSLIPSIGFIFVLMKLDNSFASLPKDLQNASDFRRGMNAKKYVFSIR